MVLLQHVVNAEHGQAAEDDDRDDNERDDLRVVNANADQQQGGDAADRQNDEARREGSINVSIKILPDMNGASVTQTR